jgi:hypothetical protein
MSASQKRTSEGITLMSAFCQKRTFDRLFDQLVAVAIGTAMTERFDGP